MVIIDYETALDVRGNKVQYSGGYICWPRQLLQNGTEFYIPELTNDLFASILVVLHLLYPSRFDKFDDAQIDAKHNQSLETSRLLQVWKDIEASRIWRQFYEAAKDGNYNVLLGMADVFCHV